MKILVTGGAGFIGSITVKQLIEEGNEVLIYDSLINGHEDSVNSLNCDFVKGCLSNKKLLDETFKKFNPDAVIHFAGFIEAGDSMRFPSKFFGNNVINGLRLLDVMVKNNIKKIIYSSSAAVYTPQQRPLKETDLKEPSTVYGETKLIFEKILKWYDLIYGIKSISLRYFNAYGNLKDLGERHNPETHLIPLTIFAALGKNKEIKIYGTDYKTSDKTCIRDYIHVSDLAKAHILALDSLHNKSNIYNVGTGKGISVKEIIKMIQEITKKEFKVTEVERRPGDPAILIANPNKIKKELGWEPKINFKQGLKETINYFKRRKDFREKRKKIKTT